MQRGRPTPGCKPLNQEPLTRLSIYQKPQASISTDSGWWGKRGNVFILGSSTKCKGLE